MEVSRVFQGRFRGIKGISRRMEKCLMGALRVFQGSPKGTSKKLKGSFKEVSKEVKEVSRLFAEVQSLFRRYFKKGSSNGISEEGC